MTCGIYKLKFKGTDKVYIGLSENIEQRFRAHLSKFNTDFDGLPIKLQEAFSNHGYPELEILCECLPSELDIYEKEAIQIYDSVNNGFNSRDGGATGAGHSVSGSGNGRSKYTNEQILEAFILLCDSNMTQKEIAEKTKISVEAVSHISAGTGHKWISTVYPDKYATLMSNSKRVTTASYFPISILNINTNDVLDIDSYENLMEISGCAYSTAVSFISGINKVLLNTWKLKNPVLSKRNKKNTYTLENTVTKEVISFTSKYAFFVKYGLVNRPKFSEFLSSGVLGSIYQGWKLLAIS